MSRSIPNTPVARRQRIVQLLRSQPVKSQSQLEQLLRADGLDVTQATLSRDLDELGASKVRVDGALVYGVTAPEDASRPAEGLAEGRLARLCEELLVSAEPSGNLAVVRTPPGAAQFFASALDQSNIDGLLGTIAGDDTIMLITRTPDGGGQVVKYLTNLAEGARPS